MQIYVLTQGLASCLFGVALLGGCNRCSCREEVQAAWCGCTPVPQSFVAQAPRPGVTGSAPSDTGGGTRDQGSPPRRIFPYAKGEVSAVRPEAPQGGPPRAQITFEP